MTRKIRKKGLKTLFLTCCVMMAAVCVPVNTAQAALSGEWVAEGGARYYLVNGEKVRGLKKIGRYKYYFNLKTGKMLKSKWKKIDNQYYFFKSDGRMAKNQWISKKYYVNAAGVRVKNCWGRRKVD